MISDILTEFVCCWDSFGSCSFRIGISLLANIGRHDAKDDEVWSWLSRKWKQWNEKNFFNEIEQFNWRQCLIWLVADKCDICITKGTKRNVHNLHLTSIVRQCNCFACKFTSSGQFYKCQCSVNNESIHWALLRAQTLSCVLRPWNLMHVSNVPPCNRLCMNDTLQQLWGHCWCSQWKVTPHDISCNHFSGCLLSSTSMQLVRVSWDI